MAAGVDDFLARATKQRWSPRQLLEHLAQTEAAERAHRSLERRLRVSEIKKFKPMADFDWSWPTKIERDVIERALTLDFLPEARNLILVGTNGLGKTMIAQNICHAAVLAGHSVLFRSAAALLEELHRQTPEGRHRKLRSYGNVGLLCVDEVGYLSFDDKSADLLYEVINRRYERKSVILTTNRPYMRAPSRSRRFLNVFLSNWSSSRTHHHSSPSCLFLACRPTGRQRRGCVVLFCGPQRHSMSSRSTLVKFLVGCLNSGHTSPFQTLSPPGVCSLPVSQEIRFVPFVSSARFAVSALSSEAIYPPSTAARANPANGCRNQSSASQGYGRFRAYPCVDERVFAAGAVGRNLRLRLRISINLLLFQDPIGSFG